MKKRLPTSFGKILCIFERLVFSIALKLAMNFKLIDREAANEALDHYSSVLSVFQASKLSRDRSMLVSSHLIAKFCKAAILP